MGQQFAKNYAHPQVWRAVYCSPMVRTQQTVAPVCEKFGLTPVLREGLKEIHFGDWEGKTQSEVSESPLYAQEYALWLAEPAWNAPPHGERATEVAQRAMGVVEEIVRQYGTVGDSGGDVLIVSHKATVRLLLCALLGIDLGRYRDRLDAPAGSVARVKLDAHGPMLLTLGDRSYLSEEILSLSGT